MLPAEEVLMLSSKTASVAHNPKGFHHVTLLMSIFTLLLHVMNCPDL